MATERRQKVLLGLLVVLVLVGAIYWLWPATSATPSASSNRQAVATRGTGRAEQAAPAQGTAGTPDVHLEALDAEKPKPTGTDRNLFRYKPKAPPPAPPPPKAAEPAVSTPVVFGRNLIFSRVEAGRYCDNEIDCGPPDEYVLPNDVARVIQSLDPARTAQLVIGALSLRGISGGQVTSE